jgi:hypothetical protein
MFQIYLQNLILISSWFGIWGKSPVLTLVCVLGGIRGKLARKVRWSRRKNDRRQKDRWATGKKMEKEEKGKNEIK